MVWMGRVVNCAFEEVGGVVEIGVVDGGVAVNCGEVLDVVDVADVVRCSLP